MAGPWEKYQTQEAGPWSKYKTAEPAAPEKTEPQPDKAAMRSEMIRREILTSPPVALARGIKDIADTGAELLSAGFDKLRGTSESARVKAMNDAGKAEFDQAAQGTVMPRIARFGGNMAVAAPAVSALGGAVAKAAPKLGAAIQSGGMATGAAPVGAVAKTADMATRMLGGGIGGYAAGGMIDPEAAASSGLIGAALPPAAKVLGYAGQKGAQLVKGAVKNGLGLSTGVGAEPVRQAFKAGQAGNREFLDNMRGDVPIDDVLGRAKQGLDAMRAQKSAQYRSGMIPVGKDKTALVFDDIEKAFSDASGVATYKGQVKNEAAAGYVARMRQAVDEWKALAPDEFHTPEGMDALKQKLGAIMESIPIQERGAKLAAGKVYAATKSTIEKQAPTYANVMRDYSKASETITEVERALSLGNKASKDTAMRKLQSLMRNNVQTNYGNRLNLANTLEEGGGVELLPSLAGQAMSSWTPRSLAGQIGGGATALMSLQNPAMAAALPFQSPQLMGNLLYRAGQATGSVGRAGNALAQPMLGGGNPALGLQGADELTRLLYRAVPALAVGR
jgi:hypothetical protein